MQTFPARLLILLAGFSGALAPALRAQENLAARLQALAEAHEGHVALAVRHLATDDSFDHRAGAPMPTASLIKLPIMVEAYRQSSGGQLELKDLVTLQDKDKVPGSGILTTHFSAGLQLSLRDAVRLMIAYSDNTATNLVLDRVGLAKTNATMEELGLPNTKVHSLVYRGATSILPERSKEFGLGSTTAQEMVQLLALLWKGKLADEAATQAMLSHLKACEDKRLSRELPPTVVAYQKTGAVNAVRTVAGILDFPGGPVAVCLLTSENKDQRWTPDNAGEVLAAKVSKLVYEHFKRPPTEPEIAAPLKIGASGERVTELQKLLNRHLPTDAQLSVDGEYGPLTEAAVRKFQQRARLPSTGQADAATISALQKAIER